MLRCLKGELQQGLMGCGAVVSDGGMMDLGGNG
jgi:hypothetical protein